MTQDVVFPDPTGPPMMRPKALDFMKEAQVGGALKITDIGKP